LFINSLSGSHQSVVIGNYAWALALSFSPDFPVLIPVLVPVRGREAQADAAR